ncbi:hypothetical protein [Brenneria uluponensis]|uniref:hypothetical protein n=1 Tax=Brenneria uluponensis TaxID=3057057 RepID=UPI0028E2A13A|nr:hypothetical protein [Brenneria ulupoensis]
MTIFIICHDQLPNYRPPKDSKIIWLNTLSPSNPQGLDVIHGYDFFENAQALHEKLSGAFGSMVILKLLESGDIKTDSITIWQYRKFVIFTKHGISSPNYPSMYVIQAKAANNIKFTTELSSAKKFILPQLVTINNLYAQYLAVHNIIDLLRYTTIAVESDVLSSQDSFHFFNSKYLVPGGVELGTYPANWWVKNFKNVASVALNFVENFEPYQKDNPYQKRAIAFCQERLGSYLLLKHITEIYGTALPSSLFGTMHSVTTDGIYRPGT